MDAVITYVDGLDPLWAADYAAAIGHAPLAKRFRDWGTLPYLLRGIERFMPFVEKVHLVVARESQVPQWVSDKVHVVLHADIMPAEVLPCFNSCTIEMFLHRIPGLSQIRVDDNPESLSQADMFGNIDTILSIGGSERFTMNQNKSLFKSFINTKKHIIMAWLCFIKIFN